VKSFLFFENIYLIQYVIVYQIHLGGWHGPCYYGKQACPAKVFKYNHDNNITKEEITMAKVQKSTDSSSLAEVVDRILDKGIVIDAWVKVSLVGIELLSVEARVVIASVETYLKYAEAIGLTASAAAPA
jgi:gas vesicle structural protein